MRGSASATTASLVLAACLIGLPAVARGQADSTGVPGDTLTADDEGLPIAEVRIEPQTIFDPVPHNRLTAFYRLANKLHVRTRTSTVRAHVLLKPGDPWHAARARESERQLRALNIFDEAEVRAQRVGDSVHVTVVTNDAWTTSPEFNIERGGGHVYGSFQFSEHNLLGRATEVAFAYREDPTGVSRSVWASDPGIAGTHLHASAGASTGSSGTTDEASFGLPFYAEDTPYSFGIRANRADTEARLFENDLEAAHFARRTAQVELYAGRGRRVRGTISRVTTSLLIWDRAFGGVTLVPGAPAAFGGGEERVRVRRLLIETRLWRPRFIERVGVDRLEAVEDIDIGRSISVAIGLSPDWFGATGTEGYAELRGSIGIDAGQAGFGWARFGAASRLVDGPRESRVELDTRWVNQSLGRQTLVLAGFGALAYRPARDFQYIVGGLNGLRAHGVHALAGDKLVRLNAESRWVLAHNYYQLLSIGAAGFWDSARTWGSGSGDQPWQHDAGIGLRLSAPHSALNQVVRIDLAWRVSPRGAHPDGAVFSFGSSQAF